MMEPSCSSPPLTPPNSAFLSSDLKTHWEFAATHRLLNILCRPLHFSPTTSTQLENALCNPEPKDHTQLLANLHARLLGIGIGESALKRWLVATARFVKQHAEAFAPLLQHTAAVVSGVARADDNVSAVSAPSSPTAGSTASVARVSDGNAGPATAPSPVPDEDDVEPDVCGITPQPSNIAPDRNTITDDNDSYFVFPKELDVYIRLPPSVRLLVLHNLAEIVFAEGDLRFPSTADAAIPPSDLRTAPLGADVTGNIYWYFGDAECVYREPPTGPSYFPDGRLSMFDHWPCRDHVDTRDSLAKPRPSDNAKGSAFDSTKTISQVSKRKRVDDSSRGSHGGHVEGGQPLSKYRRSAPVNTLRAATVGSSRAQLVEDIFGSNDSSQDSIESLGKIGHVCSDTITRCDNRGTTGRHSRLLDGNVAAETGAPEIMPVATGTSKRKGRVGRHVRSRVQDSNGNGPAPTAAPVARRMSLRLRKPPERHTSEAQPMLTSKRRGKRGKLGEISLTDKSLRHCKAWQLLCKGSEGLLEVLARFEGDRKVVPGEAGLITALHKLVPVMEEREAKIRREAEKKQKAELLHSSQKRSSRLEAIMQRRAAEERLAEEEAQQQREQARLLALHERVVKTQLITAEREQTRDIRSARRLHGNQDAIVRDDHFQAMKKDDEKVALTVASSSSVVAVRRSSRNTRNRLGRGTEANASSTTGSDYGANGLEGASSSAANSAMEEVTVSKADTASAVEPVVVTEVKTEVKEEAEVENTSTSSHVRLTTAYTEEEVDESFTWNVNDTDKLPCRVLDKFFLAERETFLEVGLETCMDRALTKVETIALGMLIPPSSATTSDRTPASVMRVEIHSINNWVIEYGREPKQWIRTPHAWYELRSPALEYHNAYVVARTKFELCARIGILGETMRASRLDYDDILGYLEHQYEEMLGYSENTILQEKRFIIEQVEAIGRKSLNQSGFLKTLVAKVRAEEKKAAADRQKTVTRAVTRQSGGGSETGGRKRSVANGGPRPVPRAVSSIISSVLKAAMKSQGSGGQRRKRKADTPAAVEGARTEERIGRTRGGESLRKKRKMESRNNHTANGTTEVRGSNDTTYKSVAGNGLGGVNGTCSTMSEDDVAK